MVMRSQKSNSKWISQKFSQEAGENNWNQYQVVLNGGSRKLVIRDSDTTSTELATSWPVLENNQKVVLTTDNSTFVTETIGGSTPIGSYAPTVNLGDLDVSVSDNSLSYTTGDFGDIAAYGAMLDVHPEGTRVWIPDLNGSIIEYNLTTPWDATTITPSGNAFAGPEGIRVFSDGLTGFTWADDGRILITAGFYGMTTQAKYLSQFRAATPYDIGSLDVTGYTNELVATTGSLNNYAGSKFGVPLMRMSPDGYKMIVSGGTNSAPAGILVTIRFQSPYNIAAIDITNGTSTHFAGFSGHGWNVTHDGRFLTQLTTGEYDPGTYKLMRFRAYPLSTPWDISSVSSTPLQLVFRQGYVGHGMQDDGNSYNSCCHSVSPCGRYLVYTATYTTAAIGSGYNRNIFGIQDLTAIGWNLGNIKSIDISNHNLSAKPIAGWTQPPKVYVSAEPNASRCAVDPVSLAYWKDSSTTSSLVIGSEESGVLVAGDTLLLDDTTTVTISDVTESAGAYTTILPIAAGAGVPGKIHYTGRTFSTGLSSIQQYNTAIYGQSFGGMWMSPDGRNLYVTSGWDVDDNGPYTQADNNRNMLVRYKLTTPWNIDTCEWVQSWDHGFLASNPSSLTERGAGRHIRDVVFNPAGTKLIAWIVYGGAAASAQDNYLMEWDLAVPWDLNTVSYVDTSLVPNTGLSYPAPCQMQVNSTGTQIRLSFGRYHNTTSGTGTRYMVVSLPTPYSISGASVPLTWTNGSYPGGIANHITSNGKYHIQSFNMGTSSLSTARYMLATVQTFGTPDDLSDTSKAAGTNNDALTPSVDEVQMNNLLEWSAVYSSTSVDNYPFGFFTSPDMTKLYVLTNDGVIRQFDIRMNDPIYKYTVTIPTQSSVPETVTMPARVTELSFNNIQLDPNDSDVLVLSTDQIVADSDTRVIQFKLEENAQESIVNSVKVNLWRSA